MNTPALPIAAAISVDRMTSPINIPDFAQFGPQLDGTQPYVRLFWLDSPCAPVDLLPVGAEYRAMRDH